MPSSEQCGENLVQQPRQASGIVEEAGDGAQQVAEQLTGTGLGWGR